MVMKPEPMFRAVRSIKADGVDTCTIMLTPQGIRFHQEMAVNLSKVPTQRLWQLKKIANRRFYFSFKRVYLILRANPFRVGLWDGIWHLLKMAFSGRELKKKDKRA